MIRATLVLDDGVRYNLDYEGTHTLEGVKTTLGNAVNSSLMYRRMLDAVIEGKTIFISPDKIRSVEFTEIKESEPVEE